MQSAIELRGTLNLDDLIRFQYLHTLSRIWIPGVMFAVVLVLFVPLFLFAMATGPSSQRRELMISTVPVLGLFLLLILILWVQPRRNAERQLNEQVYLREPVTYLFDGEKFAGAGPSTQWTHSWNVLRRVVEAKSFFVLYHGRNVGLLVPKRFFQDSEQIEEWRSLVEAHLEGKKIEKPGVVARFC